MSFRFYIGVGLICLALVALGCQRHDAQPAASHADPATGPTGNVRSAGKKSVELTVNQREVLERIKDSGGVVDGDGNVAPALIDLASDRVFADDEMVRSLAEFPELRRLRLAAAKTTPESFKVLESLTELTELFLQDAPVTDEGLARILAATPKLERLTLRRLSGVSDAILPALVSCSRVKTLALIEMNGVSSTTLTGLTNMDSLRSLDVRNCGRLTGDDFKALTQLSRLVELKLGGPAVNDGVLRVVVQHPSITSLTVEDAEVSEECLGLLAGESAFAARLRALSFARCFGVSDETLLELTQFPKLSSLLLRNIFVTGSFIAPLREAKPGPPPLKTLVVTNGFLTDDSVASLPEVFPQLVRLDLRGNAGVTDASRVVFGRLSELRQLSLDTGSNEQ